MTKHNKSVAVYFVNIILTIGSIFIVGVLLLFAIPFPGIYDSLAYPVPVTASQAAYPVLLPISSTATGTPMLSEDTGWPTPTPNPYLTPASDPRQGIAPAGEWRFLPHSHNFGTWRYEWGPSLPVTYPPNIEQIPMIKELPKTSTPTRTPIYTPGTATATPLPPSTPPVRSVFPSIKLIQSIDEQTPHNYWLVFNECENGSIEQCRTDPVTAATFYHNTVFPSLTQADPDVKLIVGGVNAHECGIRWLTEFIAAYEQQYNQPVPRAGWHFHLYPNVYPQGWTEDNHNCSGWWSPYSLPDEPNHGLRFSSWEKDVQNIRAFMWQYGIEGEEIWITEVGCLGPDCPQYAYQYSMEILGWLNSEGNWITRYAWYTDWENRSILSLNQETMLYTIPASPTATPTDYLTVVPTLTPTPFREPNRTDLGNYYAQITPLAYATLQFPTTHIYLPFIQN